jgi:hypothetical protein
MLTSAKIGKQNGDTRTHKPESGYLNLSILTVLTGLALLMESALIIMLTGL